MNTPETKEIYIFKTHVIPPEDEDDNVSLQPEDLVQKPVEEDKDEAPQAERPQTPQTQDFEVPESTVHVIPDAKEPNGTPFCAVCQCGEMTRRPWRVKGDAQHKTKIATQPGQVVSVDQLESSTLGFVAQLKGILTTQRYKYASIFVDQYSNLTSVFPQKRLTSEETVLAKKITEICPSRRVGHFKAPC